MASAAEIIDNHTKTGGEQQECQKRVVATKVDDAVAEVTFWILISLIRPFSNLPSLLHVFVDLQSVQDSPQAQVCYLQNRSRGWCFLLWTRECTLYVN